MVFFWKWSTNGGRSIVIGMDIGVSNLLNYRNLLIPSIQQHPTSILRSQPLGTQDVPKRNGLWDLCGGNPHNQTFSSNLASDKCEKSIEILFFPEKIAPIDPSACAMHSWVFGDLQYYFYPWCDSSQSCRTPSSAMLSESRIWSANQSRWWNTCGCSCKQKPSHWLAGN